MTLEERYNAAGANTYVGKVRDQQAADAGAINGVNFMNGEGFTGTPPAPDQVQAEFKRNAAGAYLYGGDGKVPAATNNKTYPLSRWLPKGVNKGDTYFTNVRYTTIQDPRNASTLVQKYSPLAGKKFDEAAFLSELSKTKISGAATGPTPGGVNG